MMLEGVKIGNFGRIKRRFYTCGGMICFLYTCNCFNYKLPMPFEIKNLYARKRKFEWLLIITSILFIVVLVLIFLLENLRTQLIATLAAIATFYLSLNKHWLDSDAIFHTLFDSFNERFNKLNDNLNIIRENSLAELPGPYQLNDNKTANQVIQDYLNLCAEEYFWYQKGRIEKEIWESWKEGIRYYLEAPMVYNYFKGQEAEDKAYYGFFKGIDL